MHSSQRINDWQIQVSSLCFLESPKKSYLLWNLKVMEPVLFMFHRPCLEGWTPWCKTGSPDAKNRYDRLQIHLTSVQSRKHSEEKCNHLPSQNEHAKSHVSIIMKKHLNVYSYEYIFLLKICFFRFFSGFFSAHFFLSLLFSQCPILVGFLVLFTNCPGYRYSWKAYSFLCLCGMSHLTVCCVLHSEVKNTAENGAHSLLLSFFTMRRSFIRQIVPIFIW